MTDSTLPKIAPWRDGKRWVYSITFDEGLVELHRFAIPILAEYGVPGHLECVAGHIGKVRQLGASSYNGYTHMGPAQLREMIARGWGVGNHTWSHDLVTKETVELEIGKAKQVLEEAVGEPITVYCSAGDNSNMSDFVLDACRRHGYLAAMSITDALNRPDDADLLWINRTFLHTQGYGPFFSAFDPYRNISYANRERGWLIDYCHCPLEKAVHPNKDCSADELRDRIETVCTEGGSDVWLARVEDAVEYRLTRRAAKIERSPDGSITVSAPGLHAAVTRRTVTIVLPRGVYAVSVDDRDQPITSHGGELMISVDLSRRRRLRMRTDPKSR